MSDKSNRRNRSPGSRAGGRGNRRKVSSTPKQLPSVEQKVDDSVNRYTLPKFVVHGKSPTYKDVRGAFKKAGRGRTRASLETKSRYRKAQGEKAVKKLTGAAQQLVGLPVAFTRKVVKSIRGD